MMDTLMRFERESLLMAKLCDGYENDGYRQASFCTLF